jgi:hypothetical protein
VGVESGEAVTVNQTPKQPMRSCLPGAVVPGAYRLVVVAWWSGGGGEAHGAGVVRQWARWTVPRSSGRRRRGPRWGLKAAGRGAGAGRLGGGGRGRGAGRLPAAGA